MRMEGERMDVLIKNAIYIQHNNEDFMLKKPFVFIVLFCLINCFPVILQQQCWHYKCVHFFFRKKQVFSNLERIRAN